MEATAAATSAPLKSFQSAPSHDLARLDVIVFTSGPDRENRMKRPSLVWLLAATAVIEAVTGISLMLVPNTDAWLLFHQNQSSAGLAASRVAGVALVALGVGSWVGRHAEGRSAALAAMLTYNAGAAIYLA